MNLARKIWLGLGLVMLSGCGGGGGGGTILPTGDGVIDTIHMEASPASGSPTIDFSSFRPGDVVQLRLVGIQHPTAGGSNIVTVAGNGWVTNAPGSVATVSANGQFSVHSGTGAATYFVRGRYLGQTFTQPFSVKTSGAVIIGRVRNTFSVGSVYVAVRFYDAASNLVASGYTGIDGTFDVVVPLTAVNFSIDTTTAFGSYYGVFAYGTPTFNSNRQGCKAPLPSVTEGSSQVLPHDIVLFDNPGSGPPEPPSGCF